MLDINIAKKEMEHTSSILLEKFSAIRDSRPTVKIFSKLEIKQSNGTVPLPYIADISQNQNMFVIKLFDSTNSIKTFNEIEKVIHDKLNFQTSIMDNQLQVRIPTLTQEKRNEYIKMISQFTEEVKISLRNIRQKYNKDIQKMKTDKDISENDEKRSKDQIQKIHDQCILTLDKLQAEKIKIMQG